MNCRECSNPFPRNFEYTYQALNGYCIDCHYNEFRSCRSCGVSFGEQHYQNCRFQNNSSKDLSCKKCGLLLTDHKFLCDINFKKSRCSYCDTINEVCGECYICKKFFCLLGNCSTMIRKDNYKNLYCTELCMNQSEFLKHGMNVEMCPINIENNIDKNNDNGIPSFLQGIIPLFNQMNIQSISIDQAPPDIQEFIHRLNQN